MVCSFVVKKNLVVMAAFLAALPAIISGVTALAGAIGGGISRNKARKAQEKAQKDYYAKQSALAKMFLDEANKDFFDTALAKSALGQMDKRYKEQDDIINANSAFTGATPEQKLAQKKVLNSSYDDQVKSLAGLATQYKQNNRFNYANTMSGANQSIIGLGDKVAGFYDTGAQQWGNVASNAMTSLGGALQNMDGGPKDVKNAVKNEVKARSGKSRPSMFAFGGAYNNPYSANSFDWNDKNTYDLNNYNNSSRNWWNSGQQWYNV